ncbi:beta-barrel assembly-enhancing protease [Desulfovibrio subterraneus]|uniref:beta-barrel assembly-enhancing protease n=1 Tax=Desulfovibrio subterraneus TaxID=2718620 RepID=UPI00157B1A26|nr:M48 family metallopeptidase [Desulfovibrio subterraneus]
MKTIRAHAFTRCRRASVRWRRSLIQLLVLAMVILTPLQASRADISDLFKDFSLKDELELGRKFSVLIKSRMPLIEDPEVVSYINDIIKRLQTDMKPQPYKFEGNVILDNSLNAFAVPGGYLFVHTGLLLELENESELAGIMGHELAHITQQHITGRIAKAKKTQLMGLAGALAGMFIGGGSTGPGLAVGSLAAAQSAMLNYSRQDEREADQMGLIYLTGAGYAPQGMVGGFEAIRKKKWQSGSTMPAYLSTHPDVDERIISLGDRIRMLPPDMLKRPEDNKRFNRIKTLIRARYTDPKIALRHFDRSAPDDCMSQMGRAIALARLNRITDAADNFDLALACSPNDFLVNREAGSFHYMKGDLDRAATLLQKAILLNPRDYMAFFFYARLLGDKGDIKGASRYFEELLLHLPEDSEIHYYYGRMLGENRYLFKGYLHLAYSALYKNDKKKTDYNFGLANTNAKTPEEKQELERFEAKYQERAEFWDK